MPKKKTVETIDNLEINKSKNYVAISVNPRIYSMSMIFSAAYVFIDKAYVIVDGDPSERIVVQLKAKNRGIDLENLGRSFLTELVNYAFYHVQYLKNNTIREAIMKRAFLSHSAPSQDEDSQIQSEQPDLESRPEGEDDKIENKKRKRKSGKR